MSSVKRLARKSVDALREGGVRILTQRVRNYLTFHKGLELKKKTGMRDILFVNGCTLAHPERYRVDHQIEQLEANGMTVEKVFYTEVKPEKLKFYRAVVIFRCPVTEEVRELIRKARYFNKRVFFDIDDLVIDRKYTDTIPYVQEMSAEERKLYDDGVVRMGETMSLCDYVITSTPALARELKSYGKEVFVNKNVASEEMVKLSMEAGKKIVKDPRKVRIGYLSGSITHNPDFELVRSAVVKIMKEFSGVELVVMGHLDLPEELASFGERVKRAPFTDWRKLPEVIAGLDINLAPIVGTVFNEAKSENKWTEAALCGTVTVASDFGIFREVIRDGETGVLCGDEEWYEKLKFLVLHPEEREQIGKAAKEVVLREYVTTYSGLELTRFIESKLAQNIGFVLPSTNISGGVNVVLKHCEILRRNGWDVMIINMDRSEENVLNRDGEINVVSGVAERSVTAGFSRLVATLYTTLEFVQKYPRVEKKLYLVQNFETDFGEFGEKRRAEANATYHAARDVCYITISKWCQEWLEEKFGVKAGFAPNGIDAERFENRKRSFEGKVKVLVEGNSRDEYKNVDESFRIVEKLDPEKFEILYLSYQGEPKSWYRVDKFYHRIAHDEVGKVYGEADVLLKSSRLESFSYPPLEMMATGGLVVVAPNGGNVEYLKDGENCLFYDLGDVEMGVRKILELVGDEKLRARLVKGAEKTVAERDWGKVEKAVLGLYR